MPPLPQQPQLLGRKQAQRPPPDVRHATAGPHAQERGAASEASRVAQAEHSQEHRPSCLTVPVSPSHTTIGCTLHSP
jgi:hypothetical protein